MAESSGAGRPAPGGSRRGEVRLEWLIFGAILALLALTLYIAWGIPEAEGVGGYPHDRLPSMYKGGSGLDRHGDLLIVGWGFGMLTLVNFVLLVGLGGRRGGRLGPLKWPLVVGFFAFAAVFTWMMVAYGDYLVDPDRQMFLGFPLPSAIMVYLLYPVSALFNVYYVVGYRHWVLTEDDQARYNELLARRRGRPEGEAS